MTNDPLESRIVPHDIEAEQCLLGSMMLDKDACRQAMLLVNPEDFFTTDHREIYNALCRLYDAGGSIDAVTVRANLKERGVYDEVGGTPYLAKILNSVPVASHAAHYAGIVSGRSASRKMIRVVGEALHRLYELKPADEIERQLLQGVASLRGRSARDTEAKPLEEILHATYDRLSSGTNPRLPSCFPAVQEMLGGYGYGEMAVVGAWPSIGKSVYVKQEGVNWALAGIPTAILSLEETEGMIAEKYFAGYAQVENKRVRNADITEAEWRRMGEAIVKLAPAKLFVRDGLHTLDDVLAAAHRVVSENGAKVLIVDHMHRIAQQSKHANLNQHFTEVSGQLKALFLRTNTLGLVAAQLTKIGQSEKRKPRASDLRESGSIFQDCDVLMLLHREDRHHIGEYGYANDYSAEVILEKNRGGTCGSAPLGWDGPHQRFVESGARKLPDGVF